jgi:hypothetical protein
MPRASADPVNSLKRISLLDSDIQPSRAGGRSEPVAFAQLLPLSEPPEPVSSAEYSEGDLL